jgi:hypothetical protein
MGPPVYFRPGRPRDEWNQTLECGIVLQLSINLWTLVTLRALWHLPQERAMASSNQLTQSFSGITIARMTAI